MSYDARTGEELWKVRYRGWSEVMRPICGRGMVFFGTDYDHPQLWAVRLDGRGDVTDTHVAWKVTERMPATPSALLVDDLLYVINDAGIASCIEAGTGRSVWQQRLDGNYLASPICGAGRIYFLPAMEPPPCWLPDGNRAFLLSINWRARSWPLRPSPPTPFSSGPRQTSIVLTTIRVRGAFHLSPLRSEHVVAKKRVVEHSLRRNRRCGQGWSMDIGAHPLEERRPIGGDVVPAFMLTPGQFAADQLFDWGHQDLSSNRPRSQSPAFPGAGKPARPALRP